MDAQPTPAAPPPKPPPPRLKASKAKKKAPVRVFVPVELPEEEPAVDRSLVLGLVLALLAMPPVAWLFLAAVPEAPELVQQIVEFTLIEPPPPPEPEPEPEPTPPPPKKVKKVDMDQVKEPIPTETAAVDEPVEEAKPVFGLSMESTVEGTNSSFKMNRGNTLMAEPTDEVVPPEDIKPLRRVSFQRLEEPPKLVRDFRAEYPEGPRSEGIEGTVIMKLTISETGKVTEVKIVRGVHPELDAAAKAAAFRFKYKPGTDGGEPVITTNFLHRYTWLIEG